MRYVLDTNIIIAALRSTKGASAAAVQGVRQGKGTFLLSTPLLFEYEAKCKEPEHLEAFKLTEDDIDVVLNVLVARAEQVETNYRWRPQLHDAKDEMVLEAAVNGRADALVTFNQSDFAAAAPRFGLELLEPKELLRRTR